MAATSTDNGQNWTYDGEALEQNPGYCPSNDVNDDGEGHPNVITVGGTSYRYTLQRPAGDNAGDNAGVGMLVHTLSPTATDPLAGLPAAEQVGVDPDAFATSGVSVPTTGSPAVTIPLNQTGLANSPEQSVAGPFVDLAQTPTPTATSIITCTGVGTDDLTGCTTASGSGISVASGDLIEQVLGTVSTAETIPKGPNNSLGTSGTKKNLPTTFSVDEAPAFVAKAPLAVSFTDGTQGSFTVAATGYPAPVVSATGALPQGVTFSNGVLSGTPEVTAGTGTYTLSVTADNGVGPAATETVTLTAIAPLAITTTTLPPGAQGAGYGPVTLTATGGEGAYSWKKVATLPRGLTLSRVGVLSGTLSTKASTGPTTVAAEVEVKEGRIVVTQTAALTLDVEAAS